MQNIEYLLPKLDSKLAKLPLESALLLLRHGPVLGTPLLQAIERGENVEWNTRVQTLPMLCLK
jgi:hypothetical protein